MSVVLPDLSYKSDGYLPALKHFFLPLRTLNAVYSLSPEGMAKRITYNILTGNDPRLGMCYYYSPHFDHNIWRRTSSLTGERTKKDPAFKGFRQSSSRLKQASPIAASLYKLVPVQIKQYTLYRTLTGEAIRMLKKGMEVALITETLKKEYIDPLLETPERNSEKRPVEDPATRERCNGMRDFTSFPKINARPRKTVPTHRACLIQKIREDKLVIRYFSSTDSYSRLQTGKNVSGSPLHEPERANEPKPRIKTTAGLIYLGRLPECKKLKVWLRPVDASDFDLGIH